VNPAEREVQWTTLMEQSLQGDSSAYEKLLVLLTVALRAAVRGRAAGAGLEPEDVGEEVVLALHLKRSTWVRGTPVAPWVAAIARNKLVDALRRRGQRVEVSIESVIETLWIDGGEHAGRTHDLDQLLSGLNERQREVVEAVSLQGYSAREAAERLKMSEVAVRVTLHRSLKALAAMFREGCYED
jgi:RNA polymerase sigma-70 factor (ECF subfamily)